MAGNIVHTITTSYKDRSSNTLIQVENPTGNAENNLDDNIAIAANHQIAWSCTRANLQSLSIYVSGAATLYTNNPSGSSPQDTIPLVAGQVRKWTLATDLIANCPFSGNVTTLYITNAGSGSIVFSLRALENQ